MLEPLDTRPLLDRAGKQALAVEQNLNEAAIQLGNLEYTLERIRGTRRPVTPEYIQAQIILNNTHSLLKQTMDVVHLSAEVAQLIRWMVR